MTDRERILQALRHTQAVGDKRYQDIGGAIRMIESMDLIDREYVAVDALLSDDAIFAAARSTWDEFDPSDVEHDSMQLQAAAEANQQINAAVAAVRAAEHPTTETQT